MRLEAELAYTANAALAGATEQSEFACSETRLLVQTESFKNPAILLSSIRLMRVCYDPEVV